MTRLPKHALQIAVATVLLGFILVNAIAPAAAQDGWVTLFDGKNLDQWDQVGGSNSPVPPPLDLPGYSSGQEHGKLT
jgi:hypothetical protein